MKGLNVPCPDEIYTKGDFKGLVFGKYGSQVQRDRSVEAFRKSRLGRAGSKTWATEDMLIEARACKKVLFGIKMMLTEWGEDKFNLWVDLNRFYLYLGNEFIMSVWVDSNGILQSEFGEEWEDYLLEETLKNIRKKT